MKKVYLMSISGRILLFSLFVLTTQLLTGQQAEFAVSADMIPASDLSEGNWKSPADYSATIVQERASAAQTLSIPSIKDTESALYNGYDKMLSYIQADLATGNVKQDELAYLNYVKVLKEYTSDPLLQQMDPVAFQGLYAALITKLIQ